jgi:hypothetical protein
MHCKHPFHLLEDLNFSRMTTPEPLPTEISLAWVPILSPVNTSYMIFSPLKNFASTFIPCL